MCWNIRNSDLFLQVGNKVNQMNIKYLSSFCDCGMIELLFLISKTTENRISAGCTNLF